MNPHGLDETGHLATPPSLICPHGRGGPLEYLHHRVTLHTRSVTVSVAGTQKTFYLDRRALGLHGIRKLSRPATLQAVPGLRLACQRLVSFHLGVLGAQTWPA